MGDGMVLEIEGGFSVIRWMAGSAVRMLYGFLI